MTNTEKPTTKAEMKKQGIVNTPKAKPTVDAKKIPKAQEEKKLEEKIEEKKETPKEKIKPQIPKVKKSEARIKGVSLPISTKTSMAICRFIRGKNIPKSIEYLEQVLAKKKALPMKGEFAHKKGMGKFGSGAGKYPQNPSEQFIKLLKNLQTNCDTNGMDNPVIAEAIANFASRPYGRFGRVKKKRTHVEIIAKEKKLIRKIEKNKIKKIKEKKK